MARDTADSRIGANKKSVQLPKAVPSANANQDAPGGSALGLGTQVVDGSGSSSSSSSRGGDSDRGHSGAIVVSGCPASVRYSPQKQEKEGMMKHDPFASIIQIKFKAV